MDAHDRLRRVAADGVDVPGTPYGLRLDGVGPSSVGRVRVDWSFRDPTGEAERIAGRTEVTTAASPAEQWRAAQLDAAYAYRRHLDLDTRPGEPYVPLRFSVDEAWELLLAHLGRWHQLVVEGGVLRVGDWGTLRTDRVTWAAYLNQFADTTTGDPSDDPDGWVPCAVPVVDGLPLWASDELAETLGAWDDVRVDGRRIVAAGEVD